MSQYDIDLEAFRTKLDSIKLSCYSLLFTLNKATREQLDVAGYKNKTNAEAIQMAFRDKIKQIDRETKEFLNKYPD